MNEPPEPSVLERLPWPAVADSIFGELDAAGVIALSTCCHTVREAVWNDDGFWHRNFVRCFGDYLPRRLVSWRSAFFATQSLGLSGTSSAPVQRQEHRGLIAKVKAVEKKVMAALTDRGQQQQQAESATSTASQTGWGTILIGVLGVRGSGKSRMLRQVQSWRGLVLHPIKCKGGCCCKQDASQRRYTVSARVMDLPQDGSQLVHFLSGVYTVVFVVNTVAPEWELEQVRGAIAETILRLPNNHKTGVPIPVTILACTTGESGRLRTPFEIVDKLEIVRLFSQQTRPMVWRCTPVSTATGEGLLEALQWVGEAYDSFLTIRVD